MTVAELIATLSALEDQNARVTIDQEGIASDAEDVHVGDGYVEITAA